MRGGPDARRTPKVNRRPFLGALFYEEAVDFLAGFDCIAHPKRLETATCPGLRRVLRVAVLRRNQSPPGTTGAACLARFPLGSWRSNSESSISSSLRRAFAFSAIAASTFSFRSVSFATDIDFSATILLLSICHRTNGAACARQTRSNAIPRATSAVSTLACRAWSGLPRE